MTAADESRVVWRHEDRDALYRRIHAIPTIPHHGKSEQCFPITDAVLEALAARSEPRAEEAGVCPCWRHMPLSPGDPLAATPPTEGLDVGRLARCLIIEGYPWADQSPPGWRNHAEAERIAREYAALGPEQPE